MNARNLIHIILILLFGATAWADQSGPDMHVFKAQIDEVNWFCPFIQGCTEFEIKPVLSRRQKIFIPRNQYFVFHKIAYNQAQIWGDTILEGDYHATGKVQLDEILSIHKKGELVGYHITYSEKAWDVHECHYDWENNETLKGCPTGRIVESTFVSPSLNTYFTNPNRIAEFVSHD